MPIENTEKARRKPVDPILPDGINEVSKFPWPRPQEAKDLAEPEDQVGEG